MARDVLVLETIVEENADHNVNRERLLAPLLGTERGVWALSPPFHGEDPARRLQWIRRDRYRGRLSRFEDLRANRPGVKSSSEEVARAFREEFKKEIPGDAVVVLADDDHGDIWSRARAREETFYVPLVDGNETIFVQANRDVEQFSGGNVAGVLRPYDSYRFAGLGRALGVHLPQRVGIIEPMAFADFKALEEVRRAGWLQPAWALVGASVFLFLFRCWWFAREKKEVDKAVRQKLPGRTPRMSRR